MVGNLALHLSIILGPVYGYSGDQWGGMHKTFETQKS